MAKPPVVEFKLGRVKCCVWENQTEKGIRHNVTFARIYKEGDDWKESTSFGRDDLLLVSKIADQAHSWIYEQSVREAQHEQEAAA